MNEADALEIIRSAVWTIILGSGPAVGTAMRLTVVSIIIALSTLIASELIQQRANQRVASFE